MEKENDAEKLRQLLRDVGEEIVDQGSEVQGVEFVIFMKDGTRVYYNSRDDQYRRKK